MTEPAGPTVAIPETRQLDVLARLLERRGFAVLRCPLIGIADTPDQDAVVAWIRRLIESPPALFVIYTGEGLDRLVQAAERAGLRAAFVAALERIPLLTRGPKPVRALRAIGLKPDHQTARPTTNGVMDTLERIPIDGTRVAVQLYGAEPNSALEAYLENRRVEVDPVAPYIYTDAAADGAVHELIDRLCAGEVDAIAFTSKAQVARLEEVALAANRQEALHAALSSVVVAAVGPVAARALEGYGIAVDVMPDDDFFMKPLVTRLADRLGAGLPNSARA